MTKAGSNDKGFESIREIKILFGREPTKGTLEKGLVLKRLSNPNLLIEMFLIQLIYLKKKNLKNDAQQKKLNNTQMKNIDIKSIKNKKAISQIKNIKQEDEKTQKNYIEKINNLEDLIKMCSQKKEMKLKYELENNVNLVSFNNMNIEIAFNEKLNKNFIKDLSEKLYEWTKNRWFISFSKEKGLVTDKEKQRNIKEKNIAEFKNSIDYANLLKSIPDIELIEIKKKDD